jgi:hypothetical protein
MSTTRGRLVYANQVVHDQADFFQSDGFTRVTGLTLVQLQMSVFFNNVVQPWHFVTGVGITDAQVASGKIYWSELPTNPGFYNVRWRPNALGYWRLIITYPAGQQIMGQDYDVVPGGVTVDSGLRESFIKPTC